MKNTAISIDYLSFLGEQYYKIANHDLMRPFFMTIVSDDNHWLFIASNGGLSAGRKNAQYALFPYYTDDKITESAEITGSKSIFQVTKKGNTFMWEPLSERFEGKYAVTRNLYKSRYGNKIVFEEINHDLELTFRYQWNSSNRFGFVRNAMLLNDSDDAAQVSMIDGLQNILPYGVPSLVQNASSNLVDAYKKSELEADANVGIYALSAIIVDRAEPSEALKANVAWSAGFDNPTILLSSAQLKQFRKGGDVKQEIDVRAEKGAYLIHDKFELGANVQKDWMVVANVNQNHADIARLIHDIKNDKSLPDAVKKDVELGTEKLIALNAGADAIQLTDDHFRDSRHFSNTLFNIMRGGIFDHNYDIEKRDFNKYIQHANNNLYGKVKSMLEGLPEVFTLADLKKMADDSSDLDFKRLCIEYMPLKFSRRHGDPSRPWNKFSINTRSEVDGSKVLDYEGNWRDIFQNWEALAISYPNFIENMIHKFLNASTFDGYNPYRITKGGFDWETIEPDDPWSYIGYWGDHQIIYLLKFLEIIENNQPGALEELFDKNLFVYANVPYQIKSYQETLDTPKDTIVFDEASDHSIRARRDELGADGALLQVGGEIYHVNFIEKILASVLAKLSNFIAEGGIWMNTQRPEWNDANNALVGSGVSMVTLYYLRRYLKFFKGVFEKAGTQEIAVSKEMAAFFHGVLDTFKKYQGLLDGAISDKDRKTILDGVGQPGSDFRMGIYKDGFSGEKTNITLEDLKAFADLGMAFLEHSIRANKRDDNMYHAYNLMTLESDSAISIAYLSEMLEGQVAALSSGYLTPEQAVDLLDGMKNSALFREDQYSYLLYPNKTLSRFMQKNTIDKAAIAKSKMLSEMVQKGDTRLVQKDINGEIHFNGNFRNADDVKAALDDLEGTQYEVFAKADAPVILEAFEDVFDHKSFTGRSGTFYGYEGLGSIYWHMVSKLQLAVQEVCLQAIREGASPETVGRLVAHYYEINEGIGVHKSPELYGAFPTDAYSHTPGGKGAQQPGMTGQVKEDILSRFGELGAFVDGGQLYFHPCMLRKEEFLTAPATFHYVDVHGKSQSLELAANSLAFTYCQIPIVYELADKDEINLVVNGENRQVEGRYLDKELSQKIFGRSGAVTEIRVSLERGQLK